MSDWLSPNPPHIADTLPVIKNMKSIILDTSTFIDFCQLKHFDKNSITNDAVNVAIESLILYDNIGYDQRSIENIIDYGQEYTTDKELEQLENIKNLCVPIESYDFDISKINGSILNQSRNFLDSNLSSFKTTKIHPDSSSVFQDFEEYIYPDNNAFFYHPNHSKPIGWYPPNEMILEKYVKKYGVDTKYFSEIVIPHLVRIFYYHYLQNETGYYYVPHPKRNSLFLKNEIKLERRSVIEAFKKKVLNPYLLKKNDYLGLKNKKIRIPLLTNFLLERASNFNELLNEIKILRSSDYALKFREAMLSIEEADRKKNEKKISEILNELEDAMENWKISLGESNISRNIEVCEIEYFDNSRVKDSKKLLSFVHYISNF